MNVIKFRVARPTADLEAVRAFYVDGLGLVDRGTFEGHAGYDGQLLGTTDGSYEIEFTHREDDGACPPPSGDNLLVFYVENEAAVSSVASRLLGLGVEPVDPVNPYWIGKGLTFADPDGWRVVVFNLETLARNRGA